ncbi:hypothetical protein Vadar_024453 [Vaccinium darrowii]|uniref:Uncharacterized protein n=1 Tax=Vaccinium darrowii TaxID=229202 RepID=A0ACB7YYY2_9ERIC|nr:hypothetical protein Vadar_024453 [Vaccinium darrowii]
MVRERQTASNRRRKALEVTQTRKDKWVRCTDALPQEQPPHVEEAEEELENQEQEVPSRDGPSSDVVVGDAENEDDGDSVTLLQECLGISQTEARAALNGGKSVGLAWLKENFMTVKSTDSDERVGYCVRAYLLFVLGCTLFIDKSGTNVDVSLLSLLSDLEKVDTYTWGTGGLAYLCRRLAWIHEHFPTLQQPENLNYTKDLPRAHRWLPRRKAGNVSVSHYRRMLDDLRVDQVIFDPYKARRGDVPPIVFYTGPIRGMSIVEPYLPDRVLRQFGLVQTSWEYHIMPEAKRIRTRADVSWECYPNYLEWLSRYSHCRVSPDAGAGEGEVNTGGNDGMKLAAIAAEVDKVYADELSPFNMRQALRNISKILRPNTEGEPTTPFTTESYTRCH